MLHGNLGKKVWHFCSKKNYEIYRSEESWSRWRFSLFLLKENMKFIDLKSHILTVQQNTMRSKLQRIWILGVKRSNHITNKVDHCELWVVTQEIKFLLMLVSMLEKYCKQETGSIVLTGMYLNVVNCELWLKKSNSFWCSSSSWKNISNRKEGAFLSSREAIEEDTTER